MSTLDPYRTPAAPPEEEGPTGDDLCLARALSILWYSALIYILYLAATNLRAWVFNDESDWAGYILDWVENIAAELVVPLGMAAGFSVFLMRRSGELQGYGLAALGTLTLAFFVGHFASRGGDDAITWGTIVPALANGIGYTFLVLLMRRVVGERSRAAVLQLSFFTLLLMWIATVSDCLYAMGSAAASNASTAPIASLELQWTTYILSSVAAIADAICNLILTNWVRADVQRLEPLPDDLPPSESAEPHDHS